MTAIALPRAAAARPLDLARLSLAAAVLVGAIIGIAQALGAVADPFDWHFYWAAPVDHLYPATWGEAGGYVYAPPLALAIGLLHPLGYGAATILWTTAQWAALWYCCRQYTALVVLASFAAVPLIGGNLVGLIFMGNVQMILAAAIVASVRHPAAAVLPLLTKAVGLPFVWYAVRREWRHLAIALAATAAVVGLTLLLAPWDWADFITFMTHNGLANSAVPIVPIPWALRLAAAVALTAWGARTDRPWALAIAAGVAIPALYWWTWLPVWCGCIALRRPMA